MNMVSALLFWWHVLPLVSVVASTVLENNAGLRRALLTKKQLRRKERRKEKRIQMREKLKESNRIIPSSSNSSLVPSISLLSDQGTLSPSNLPISIVPTKTSISPSETPTVMATSSPSHSVSMGPSLFRTSNPSEMPTMSSHQPSTSIAERPSISPSQYPTGLPSSSPTSWPTSSSSNLVPSRSNSQASPEESRISCDEDASLPSNLSLAFIHFQYLVNYQPSLTNESDAVILAETLLSKTVADELLQCTSSGASLGESSSSLNVVAVDSLPFDVVSNVELCNSTIQNWVCAVVNGALTTYFRSDDATLLGRVNTIIKKDILVGEMDLNGSARIIFSPSSPTEQFQQAPVAPFSENLEGAPSIKPSSSKNNLLIYGLAVAAAFIGSASVAVFIYSRVCRRHVATIIQADKDGNVEPLDQYVDGSESGIGSDQGSRSYLSDDTFWQTITGHKKSTRNRHENQEEDEDASVALSSLGVSLRGALGIAIDDDMEFDMGSCESDSADPCLQHHQDGVSGSSLQANTRSLVDRLGLFKDPK